MKSMLIVALTVLALPICAQSATSAAGIPDSSNSGSYNSSNDTMNPSTDSTITTPPNNNTDTNINTKGIRSAPMTGRDTSTPTAP